MGLGTFTGAPLVCLFGCIQAVGLVASMSSRVAEGTRYEGIAQWICLGALGLVGGLCGFAIQFGPGAAAISSAGAAGSVKSICTSSAGGSGSTGNRSMPTILPAPRCWAIWIQPPGAQPRSTMSEPLRISLKRSSISDSLKAARLR